MHRFLLTLTIAFALSGVACGSRDAPPVAAPAPTEVPSPKAEAEGWDTPVTTLGERVYVPIYSHIFFRDSRRDIDLTATLSVRNADAAESIQVTAVRYYDSDGALVRRYLDAPLTVGPMASTAFLVEQRDDTGGVGANFIVEWRAERGVVPPVIEAVMIGAASSQGISFVTQGRVLQHAQSTASFPSSLPSTEPTE